MNYKRPSLLFSGHLETIYPALFRTIELSYERERIFTPDGDFLDLDWIKNNSKKLVIISHGLEGNSSRAYMKGMAKAFSTNGFDVIAWNFRGCSDEMNKMLRFYHSGATDDLDLVVRHAQRNGYTEIYLIGFSLGGNLTLKYLGERNSSSEITKAVVFSTPLDLHTSCLKISKPGNVIYSARFIKSLKNKVIQKSKLIPGLDLKGIERIDTLISFDDRYTAPLHGFDSALDYYNKCSSINFIESITLPTLIVNAQNDPFLSELCYPVSKVKNHPWVKFENPRYGGHVGFAQFDKNGLYWSEERALSFLTSSI
ncbi:MAG TPA: alpha/beta fold hydrolase [Chryseolinea sp.]|nr:alpha/beta fold hydrolase [Chryseolinea sp.]